MAFGLASFGTALFGHHPPPEPDPGGGKLFRDPRTGEQKTGRFIDPKTRQYVFDSNGRTIGMSTAQQLVLLAVATDEASSAVESLGNRLKSIKRFGTNFDRELRDVYANALGRLTASGLIELLDVTYERVGPSGVYVRLKWRDLTTNQLNETRVR